MQKILSLAFVKEKKKQKKRIIDSYQESLNRIGREQFLKILDRGISLKVTS